MARTKQAKRTADGASNEVAKRPCKPAVAATVEEDKEATEQASIIEDIKVRSTISPIHVLPLGVPLFTSTVLDLPPIYVEHMAVRTGSVPCLISQPAPLRTLILEAFSFHVPTTL